MGAAGDGEECAVIFIIIPLGLRASAYVSTMPQISGATAIVMCVCWGEVLWNPS